MEYPRNNILVIAVLMEGAVLALALALAWYFNINLLPVTQDAAGDIIIGTLGAVPPFALFIFTLSKKAEKIPLLGSLKEIVVKDIKGMFLNSGFMDLVLISLLAGIAEEILFRGVIQTRFGIVAASAVFGLVHCVSPAYIVVTVIMGFYIGAFYFFSGSLLIPIQIHFIYDLGALLYLRYFAGRDDYNL